MHTRALLPKLLILLGLLTCPLIGPAATPTLGAAAPAFRLQGEDGKWHELEDYRGKWLALYFYPKDQAPGCTAQACGFRDDIAGFREAGVVVLGISVDIAKRYSDVEPKGHSQQQQVLNDVKALQRSQKGSSSERPRT